MAAATPSNDLQRFYLLLSSSSRTIRRWNDGLERRDGTGESGLVIREEELGGFSTVLRAFPVI